MRGGNLGDASVLIALVEKRRQWQQINYFLVRRLEE